MPAAATQTYMRAECTCPHNPHTGIVDNCAGSAVATPPTPTRSYSWIFWCFTAASILLYVSCTCTEQWSYEALLDQSGSLQVALDAYRDRARSGTDSDLAVWLDCNELSSAFDVTYLAGGWTKAVFTARYKPTKESAHSDSNSTLLQIQTVALKTVRQNGTQIQRCLSTTPQQPTEAGSDYDACYWKAREKIMKEVFLLTSLNHHGIIRLYGYCDVDLHNAASRAADDAVSSDSVIVVTELGQPFNLLDLLQMRWTDRLKIAISLLEILDFLAQKGLVLNDLRQSQFVLVRGQLKLVDLDDVNQAGGHSHGRAAHAFYLRPLSRANVSAIQLADSQNLQNAYRHFFKFIVTHGSPRNLRRFARSFTRSIAVPQYSSRFYVMLLRNVELGINDR